MNEVPQTFKVIIAGGRHFSNYDLVKEKCLYYLQNKLPDVTIVSGGATGADALGERFANEMGLSLIVKKANWEEFGKKAGIMRNAEMVKVMNVEELKEVLSSGDWSKQSAVLGTHIVDFEKDPESAQATATAYLRYYEVWTANFRTLESILAPTLDELRSKPLDATAAKYDSWTDDQVDAFYKAMKARRAGAPVAPVAEVPEAKQGAPLGVWGGTFGYPPLPFLLDGTKKYKDYNISKLIIH